jgi:hypothetical protein
MNNEMVNIDKELEDIAACYFSTYFHNRRKP